MGHSRGGIESEPVTHIELENGLRLIIQRIPGSQVASVQTWIRAGSITEGEFLGSGLSHFLEHMAFKGTPRRTGNQIAQEVQGLGGYINAYTTFDRTVYYIDLPLEGWRSALDILIDSAFRSTLPEEEFEKEREVIRREFAMGHDDPDRELLKLLFRTAYTTHPCRHPVIGHLELFNRLTREAMLAYYRRQYGTGNTVVIITGDITPEEARDYLRKITEDVPAQTPPSTFLPEEPRQLGKREAHKSFVTDVTRMFAVFHIPPITHPDLFALDVLANISGQGQSSRLHQTLVEQERILRSIAAFSYTPAQAGLWGIGAILMPNSSLTVHDVEERILRHLRHFAEEPVSEKELAKAKRQALTSRANELKTTAGRAASLGSSWFTAQDTHFGDAYLRGIEQVTAFDILRVAKTYFTEENLTLVSLHPEATATQASTASGTVQAKDSIQVRQLSNGTTVILLRDVALPLVTVRLCSRGGLLLETAEKNGLGALMIRLLDKGTRKRSAEELASEIECLGGSLSTDYGNSSWSAAIETLSTDLEQAIELLSDLVLNSTFPETELEKEKQKLLADLNLENDQPMAIARNALRKTLFGAHPYGLNRLGDKSTIPGITREDLSKFLAALLNSGSVVLSVAGRFEVDAVLLLLENAFKSLPSGKPHPLPAPPVFSQKETKITISVPKEQAVIQMALPATTLDSPDRAALMLIDEALSDQGSRLFHRIREEQSLAYFVGSSLLLAVHPGYFMLYAGTDPKRSEHAALEMRDELAKIARDGLAESEILRARAKLLGERLIQDQSAGMTAFRASLNHLFGLGSDFEDRLNHQIRHLTTELVNKVATRYFTHSGCVQITVQPDEN